jgi:hypothetical protein
VITSAAHAALALSMAPPQAPAELGLIDVELARLAESGIEDGPTVESLQARRADLVREAADARSTRTQAIRGRAVSLVKAATAGDEPARAELEVLSRRSPRSFPAGFGDAIANARFDRTIVARLQVSLTQES